jgi:hypothetical protein
VQQWQNYLIREKFVIYVDFISTKKSVSKAMNSNGEAIMNWEKGKICNAVTVASIGQGTAETWVNMIVSGPLVITARRALSLRNEGLVICYILSYLRGLNQGDKLS